VKKFIFGVVSVFLISGFLLFQGVLAFADNADVSLASLGGLMGAMGVVYSVAWVYKLFRDGSAWQTEEFVTFQGGEISFPILAETFELWLFSEVPLTRYYGEISIRLGQGEQLPLHNIPRRLPLIVWFWWRPKSDLTPIVWRTPKGMATVKSEGRLKFNLTSTFANTIWNSTFPTDVGESITLVLRTRRRGPSDR
jgi:hypothetical protein